MQCRHFAFIFTYDSPRLLRGWGSSEELTTPHTQIYRKGKLQLKVTTTRVSSEKVIFNANPTRRYLKSKMATSTSVKINFDVVVRLILASKFKIVLGVVQLC